MPRFPKGVPLPGYYDAQRKLASPFGQAVINRLEHLNINLTTLRLRTGYSSEKFYTFIRLKDPRHIRLDYVPDILRIATYLEMDAIPLIQLFFHIEERRMAALMQYLSVDSRLSERDQEALSRIVAAYPIPEEKGDGEEKSEGTTPQK